MTLRFSRVPNLPAAEKCMAEMIAYWDKDPSTKDKLRSAAAHLAYGLWLEELGKHTDAVDQAKAVLALTKDHPAALHLAGQANLALKHYPDAEKYARRGIEVAPQDFAMYMLMADVCVTRTDQPGKTIVDRREDAVKVLSDGVQTIQYPPAKAELLYHLANLYLDGGRGPEGKNLAAAAECIKRMREYHYSPAQIDFLEARVLYTNDNWPAALKAFDKVRSQLADLLPLLKFLDYWRGCCLLQESNPDAAMAAFISALDADKFYFKARDGIAQIDIENGKLRDAVEEYRQALVGNPADAQAWLAFTRTVLLWNLRRSPAEQDWNLVLATIQKAEEFNPRDGQLQLQKAGAMLAHDQQLKETPPDDAREKRWQALLQNEPKKTAAELIEALRADSPKSASFWVAKANLAAGQGEMDEARKILSDARDKLGDKPDIRLAQARFLLREQGLSAGPQILKLAGAVEAFSRDDKTFLWNGLVESLMEIKEYDMAKDLCRRIADLHPHDATIRYRLLELAILTHNARDPAPSLAEVDRVLEEIEGIAGRGPLWLYGKAVRLKLEAGSDRPELLDQAMKFASDGQAVRRLVPPPGPAGRNLPRQHRDDEALQHYLRAVKSGDRDLELIRLLLQMLYDRQRYQEADQVIQSLDSGQTALTPEIDSIRTRILAQWGPFDQAWESANRAYDANSTDYRDHLWHGRELMLLVRRAELEGHPDELPKIAEQAEQVAPRARRIAPKVPDCHVALVQLLVATGQRQKAEYAASDAEDSLPYAVSPLAMGISTRP